MSIAVQFLHCNYQKNHLPIRQRENNAFVLMMSEFLWVVHCFCLLNHMNMRATLSV